MIKYTRNNRKDGIHMVLSYDQKMIDALGIQESLNWIEEAKKEYERNHEPAFQYILNDKLFCLFCDLPVFRSCTLQLVENCLKS